MESWIITFGYFGLFAATIVGNASIMLPVPIDGLVLAAAGFLDPLIVTIVATIGSSIGEMSAYYIGLGGRYVVTKGRSDDEKIDENDIDDTNKAKKPKVDSAVLKKIERILHKHGFITIPVFAFTPLPIDPLGIVCGGIAYNVKKFFLGVLIGKFFRMLVISLSAVYAIDWIISLVKWFGIS